MTVLRGAVFSVNAVSLFKREAMNQVTMISTTPTAQTRDVSRLAIGAAVAIAALLTSSGAAFGQSWDGFGGDNLWSSGGFTGNWSGSNPPVSDNNTFLYFSASAQATSVQNISPVNPFRLYDMTFNASSGGMTISGGPLRWVGGRLFQNSNSAMVIQNNISSVLNTSTAAAPLQLSGNGLGAITLSGTLSTVASIQKVGDFPLVLSGTNSITGQIVMGDSSDANNVVGGGTLVITSLANIGTATLALNGGSKIQYSPLLNIITRALTLGGTPGGVFDIPANETLTYNAAIGGTGQLVKEGPGTMELLINTNSFSGGVSVQGGTLIAMVSSRLGGAAGPIVLANGAQLRIGTGAVSSRSITTNAGGGTIEIQAGTQTFAGTLNGAGLLTKTGAGVMTLSAAANGTATGGLYISQGALIATRGANFGATGNVVRMASGTSIEMVSTAAQTTANPMTVEAGSASFINNNALLGVWTLSGVISGSGVMTKNGPGVIVLSGIMPVGTTLGGMVANAGEIRLTGTARTPTATVAGLARISGTGTLVGTLGGSGFVTPGVNNAGLLTASKFDAAIIDMNIDIVDPAPAYATANAIRNDVLRLTDPAPFASAMTSGAVINVYVNATIPVDGASYKGGIFTDSPADFAGSVSGATWNVYESRVGGPVTYQGVTYALTSRTVSVSTVAETAPFAAGSVAGRVLRVTFAAPSCALADVAADGLDTVRNPDFAVGPADLDAFIAAFIAGNASVADVASDSLDTVYTPNGSVGAEDLDAFIASFIAGC